MRSIYVVPFILMLPFLTGCCQSVKPVISAEEAECPFTRLTCKTADDDGQYTLVREGDEYIDPDDEAAPRVEFRELRENIYPAQGRFAFEDAAFYSLALVEADLSRPEAMLHAGFAEKSGSPADRLADHGFADCDQLQGMICLDKRDDYLTCAPARIDNGEAPDEQFAILSHE